MRRKDKEISDPVILRAVLTEARICRLAMADGDMPYVVPLCFGFRGNALFFHSASEGKKIEALRKNPAVCFEVDTYFGTVLSDKSCGCSMAYRSVIGFGTAVFLEDMDEKREALEIIARRYADVVTGMSDGRIRATAVIRVDILSMTGKVSGAPARE